MDGISIKLSLSDCKAKVRCNESSLTLALAAVQSRLQPEGRGGFLTRPALAHCTLSPVHPLPDRARSQPQLDAGSRRMPVTSEVLALSRLLVAATVSCEMRVTGTSRHRRSGKQDGYQSPTGPVHLLRGRMGQRLSLPGRCWQDAEHIWTLPDPKDPKSWDGEADKNATKY